MSYLVITMKPHEDVLIKSKEGEVRAKLIFARGGQARIGFEDENKTFDIKRVKNDKHKDKKLINHMANHDLL